MNGRQRRFYGLLVIAALAWLGATGGAQEAPPMALDDVLAYAINHNPRIAAAVAHVANAQAGVALVKAQAWPAVTLRGYEGVQVPRAKIVINPNDLLPVPLPIELPVFQIVTGQVPQQNASVGVVWPLWTGGRLESALGAARAQVGTGEADLQQATEQLLYEAGAGFYEVLRTRHAEAAAAAALRRAEEDLRTAEVGRAAGVVTGASVSALVAAKQAAGQNLALAKTAVTDAEHSLNELLGRGLDEPVRLDDRPVVLEAPEAPESSLLIALATRPELLALDYRRDAARAAIAQEKAQRMPMVSLNGQAGLQSKSTPFLTPNFEALGLQFSWPFPLHGEPAALRQQTRASLGEIEETGKDLRRSIAYQVETTARRIVDARERLAAAQEAVKAAEAAAAEAKASHAAGAATRQQLTAAETALTEAQARQSEAEAGLKVAQLSRVRALGLMRTLFLSPPQKADQR